LGEILEIADFLGDAFMFFMFVCILLDLVSIGFLDRLGFEAADIYNRFFREVFF
jgi:hypothetical protein